MIWEKLQQHYREIRDQSLSALFQEDLQRFSRFSLEEGGLLLDYSKNHIQPETLELLFELARACKLHEKIEALMSGDIVNISENRPALHTALRRESSAPLIVDQHDIMPGIHSALSKMNALASAVRERRYLGFSGQPIDTILHFGIGGSDFGPMMLFTALEPFVDSSLHYAFFSHQDPAHIQRALQRYNPATTLIIIASKSFTTTETLVNAEVAKRWLWEAAPNVQAAEKQMIAVTAVAARAEAFGVAPSQILPIWDWVGGRFSVWSAMSLIVAIAVGPEHFRAFLRGAEAMDLHFRRQDFAQNQPVILGLLDIWYSRFWDKSNRAVIPYGRLLRYFPDYLQQVFMESLGKGVDQAGRPLAEAADFVVWGGAGTNSQHSFHQLLLQGRRWTPVDFILPSDDLPLTANGLAQSQLLMTGYGKHEKIAPEREISGNRPSHVLLIPTVTPEILGRMMALYEHRVYVNSVIGNINAFDQWGVERGKIIAKKILDDLTQTTDTSGYDHSTQGLIRWIKNRRHPAA